jgi:hypothetical protein
MPAVIWLQYSTMLILGNIGSSAGLLLRIKG